jgi:hypothetical protein
MKDCKTKVVVRIERKRKKGRHWKNGLCNVEEFMKLKGIRD